MHDFINVGSYTDQKHSISVLNYSDLYHSKLNCDIGQLGNENLLTQFESHIFWASRYIVNLRKLMQEQEQKINSLSSKY